MMVGRSLLGEISVATTLLCRQFCVPIWTFQLSLVWNLEARLLREVNCERSISGKVMIKGEHSLIL